MAEWVTWITNPEVQPRTKHFVGLPPVLTDHEEPRTQLPSSAILVIKQMEDSFFLYRYSDDGRFAGDTWHKTFEDAVYQANVEFSGALASWTKVPEGVSDPVRFAAESRSGKSH